jgi:PhoH-like ATPase
MKHIFIDTNILMSHSLDLFNNDNNTIYICDVVLSELDKHKTSSDPNKQFQARQAHRLIKQNKDKVKYCMKNGDFKLPDSFGLDSNDNKIISIYGDLYSKNHDILMLSNDLNVQFKCECLGLPVEEFGQDDKQTDYKGFKELSGNTEFINTLFDEIKNGINKYNFLTNEYLILHNTDTNKFHEYRYNGNKFIELKLPSSKIIKGVNSQQRCVLDLLSNKDIPIKIVAGTYGSGKSYLTTKMGLYHIFDKGNYGKMLLLRNPLGSGEEIGFLPGNKEEKIGDFFKCIEQYIDPFISKDKNINEYIKKDVPFYIKGMSYGSTYVLVDESEDMDLKILKLIGSRIESDSCVVFCGDYKQSEYKYQHNNGLYQLIEKLKGNPLVGIIVMDEDVRSEASKVFADI